jgi:hypothetical protein
MPPPSTESSHGPGVDRRELPKRRHPNRYRHLQLVVDRHLHEISTRKSRYSYGVLTAAELGAEVEAV